ncbi:MAG: hypothetical protein IJ211_03220 [Campylobacter sp.]|nr:hypothetical protein [Campylobacter sp.]
MTHKANLNQTLAITLLRYASQETFFFATQKKRYTCFASTASPSCD